MTQTNPNPTDPFRDPKRDAPVPLDLPDESVPEGDPDIPEIEIEDPAPEEMPIRTDAA
ncbi:hypothetical protein [Brevundimonas vesicularis]|uniref:hypothetical protein n=1 Tax=Brevundimonas vesicularis TaxID=41276 RepID=UPI0038D47099